MQIQRKVQKKCAESAKRVGREVYRLVNMQGEKCSESAKSTEQKCAESATRSTARKGNLPNQRKVQGEKCAESAKSAGREMYRVSENAGREMCRVSKSAGR